MKKIIFFIILVIFLILVCVGSIFIGTGYNMYTRALNNESIESKFQSIKNKPDYTKLEEMSNTYKDAVIAVEDHRFYKHNGVDIISVMRAIVTNMVKGKVIEGGSSITQQLAKNTYFTQDKTITRKVAEAFLAWKYEKELDKDTILELYVNTSYFGSGYYDIGSASKGYFNKSPSELNDYEATLLAGLPNAPSIYNPTINFELASQRQAQVLNKMVKYKYIDENKKAEILSLKKEYEEYFSKKDGND